MPYRAIKTIELRNGKTYEFGAIISDNVYSELSDEHKKMFLENVFDTGDRGDIDEEGRSAFRKQAEQHKEDKK